MKIKVFVWNNYRIWYDIAKINIVVEENFNYNI